ncbi:MAG: hypothetical protein LBL45_12075 [Treponema sp.]|jgi:hypothetical protein|nr:hypothetical protein [Treponema sp.]
MKAIKAAFGICVLSVVTLLASGCGSSPATPSSQGGRGNPPEIAAWIQQHQDDDIHYATGISEFENESDAMQQALALARENLAASLETEVAAISENAVRRAEAQGQTDRIARFQDATKQLVSTTLRNVRTFGPYVNGRGNTYIIVYLDKRNFQKDVNDIVEEAFAEANSQLNNMLGIE